MAKYLHPDVLDNGPQFIKTNCNKVILTSAYAFGATYATTIAGLLAEATMTSADFTLGTSGNDRTLTTASGKQDSAANASGSASHIAFVDTVNSKVLWVTEETSGQSITTGNPVTFPALVYTSKQPTSS